MQKSLFLYSSLPEKVHWFLICTEKIATWNTYLEKKAFNIIFVIVYQLTSGLTQTAKEVFFRSSPTKSCLKQNKTSGEKSYYPSLIFFTWLWVVFDLEDVGRVLGAALLRMGNTYNSQTFVNTF